MINDIYFHLNDKLIKGFKKIKDKNEHEVFVFLRQYIKYIESDDECYNRYFILSDPLVEKDKTSVIMKNFNDQMEIFLENLLKTSRGNIKKKSYESDTACYLGTAYEYGLFNKPKDHSVAFYYYTISAQLHSEFGTFKLAMCYEKGIGTPINYDKAIYFYRCAAKLGLVDGMHVYGTILSNGYLNCPKDAGLGRHFLALSGLKADTIYPYSLFDIGKCYENKNNDKEILTDNEYAMEMYLKGAKLGDPNCMYRLAKAYENGDIVKTADLNKSFDYHKMAASKGHMIAQIRMSELYFQGKCKKNKPDFNKSYMWAVFSATKGNGRAAYIVGEYVMNGCGIQKNKLLALWWFMISSSLDYDKADAKINDLAYWAEKNNDGVFEEPRCCKIFC